MRDVRISTLPDVKGPGDLTRGSRVESALRDLARRLAEMLGRMTGAGSPHAPAVAFLQAFSAAEPLDDAASADQEISPLDRLVAALSLSHVEIDLLLLAGMPDEHEGFSGVLRSLHPRGEPRATVGLAAQLLCNAPGERRLLRSTLECGALTAAGALVLQGDAPFAERSLALAEALWSALQGVDVWPAIVAPQRGHIATEGLDDWLASPAATVARTVLARRERRVVLVIAESEDVALGRAAALAAAAGVAFARFALPKMPGLGPDLERLAGLHALVRGAVPLVRLASDVPGAAEAAPFAGHPGPIVLCARAGTSVRGRRPLVVVHADPLDARARRAMWSAALPDLVAHADVLAARYPLEPEAVIETSADVRDREALEGRSARLADVIDSVRARSSVAFSAGVTVIRPRAAWEELVLPRARAVQLREATARLAHQARVLDDWGFRQSRTGARGVRVLFVGPPGTGKTLSAEVMAGALGMELLLVDIARIVSKWIGETEKNLATVFDVAERSRAVLFFDEADALFGKRTEVSDAHDRYANLETAYLLSRLERFDGLAVLSTNLRKNIDAAFIRRLEFVIDFEEPGPAEREQLWRCHVPSSAPVADEVSFAELAALYPIVGGLIRNAAVAAGFLAAADSTAISRRHFVRAIQREYEKSGRAFPGAPAGVSTL